LCLASFFFVPLLGQGCFFLLDACAFDLWALPARGGFLRSPALCFDVALRRCLWFLSFFWFFFLRRPAFPPRRTFLKRSVAFEHPDWFPFLGVCVSGGLSSVFRLCGVSVFVGCGHINGTVVGLFFSTAARCCSDPPPPLLLTLICTRSHSCRADEVLD